MNILNEHFYPLKNKALLIAHRGNSHEYPENTLAAFEGALGEGITGMETDIQMSKDGIPVLFHDKDLSRITGIKKKVGELTLEELKCLDLGTWFHPSFDGERILTLEEFLSRYGEKAILLLEIKARSGEDPERSQLLAEKTLEAVVRRKLVERVLIISFNQEVLETILEKKSDVRTGFIMEEDTPSLSLFLGRKDLSALCIYIKILSESFARTAQNAGKQLFTYPCDTPEEVDKAMSFEVDGIISNRPRWLHAYLSQL